MFTGRYALARHQKQSLFVVLLATAVAGVAALSVIKPSGSDTGPVPTVQGSLITADAGDVAPGTAGLQPSTAVARNIDQLRGQASTTTSATPAPTAPRQTRPPATRPPTTRPPVTEPPVTPITEPPITEPPVTPITEPPITEPPVTPITEPPITEPPVTPITEPPVTPITEIEPPEVTSPGP